MSASFLRTERGRALAALVVPLVLIAGIEMSNTLRQTLGRGLSDAWHAGLLAFSAFGLVCLLAGLIPSQAKVRAGLLVVLYAILAALGSILFFSWLAFWLTGRPVNVDAMSILIGSPLGAFLHLLSSDPLMLLGIVVALAAFLYAMLWLLRVAVRAAPFVPRKSSALLAVLFGLLTLFVGLQIAATPESRSSYAALIGNSGPDAASRMATYSCPRAPYVPLSAAAGGPSNGAPVIVLMMESLRSDLMSTYAAAMPNMQKLAAESAVYERAYATSSHSDYEDLSFWYSRYPLRADHRLGYAPDAPWRGISVFEYFKVHGYSTAYFSSQNEKWGDMVNWLKIPAVDTYFDSENFTGETWENPDDEYGLIALVRAGIARSGKVEDARTLEFAGEWIDKHANEPFFMGLNLQNTHYNYFIPENGQRPYQPDKLGFRAVYSAWPEDQAPAVRNRYLNAAYNMDAAVGQFIERLKRAGIWDKAIVLAIGDGGEAFYEHGFGNHSGPMYEEVAKTLAILKFPKGDPRNGTKSGVPISHVDFVPGLIDAAGMSPWPGFQGMAPWKQPPATPVYMTVNAISIENTVVNWPWKLTARTFPARQIELYNLKSDPLESRNAVKQQPDVALSMLKDLQTFRSCQIGYYADAKAYTRIEPPRFQPQNSPAGVSVVAVR